MVRRRADGENASLDLIRAGRRWRLPALLLLLLLVHQAAFALELEVRVEGLSGERESNVLALLAIQRERDDRDLTPARVLALHRMAPDQIADALAPFGLYRVRVAADLKEPAGEGDAWIATYRVDPGEPIRVGSVDYRVEGEGAGDPAFPGDFPMKVGDVLLHSVYEKAKSDLRYSATSAGFLDCRMSLHQVLIDPLGYSAHIQLHLQTGPRYRLGPIGFRQDLLDEGFLRQYLTFKSGDVYDPDLLLALQGRLLGSEYYGEVEIVPRKDEAGPDHAVPIEVVAKRNKANKYRVGLGFATDIGPRLSLDYRRRYLGAHGHKLRTTLSLAPALSQFEFDYRIPIQDPTRDYIIIKPRSSRYDTDTRRGWTHSLQAAHSTLTGNGWRRNIGIDYSYEDFDLDDGALGATNELVPNISWSRTVSDDPINTGRGYRLKYTLLGAVEGLVSESSYLSGQIQFKWVRRFARDYRLLTRADLGATWAGHPRDLPASRRFYAGGDNSIRGWGFEALGPNDPRTDETLGGRYLAVGSLELERRIHGPWSVAVFTDFGNAFDPDYAQSFAQSAGLGIRWASPIGQVRLDLAFALTKDGDEGGLPPARLHVVIGPDL